MSVARITEPSGHVCVAGGGGGGGGGAEEAAAASVQKLYVSLSIRLCDCNGLRCRRRRCRQNKEAFRRCRLRA